MRDARAELTGRWLERIVNRVEIDRQRVFPTDDLLDHMPLLVVGIADYIEDSADVISADSSVVFHARELGALRHTQGFNEYQILKEFELLGGILFAFLMRVADDVDVPCTRGELLACAQRLFQAIAIIQQATTTRFLELAKSRLAEREARLRAFHRALTHEMRNRIGATLGAGQVLQIPDVPAEQRGQLADVVVRNADAMRLVLENLLELSRLDDDTRQERRITLRAAVFEVGRQLRDAATAAAVDIVVPEDLPSVEVNAAAMELCLTNLIANGIKYADRSKARRWVEVRARAETTPDGMPSTLAVEVRDNGIGVPDDARPRLFERFFRAHESLLPAVEGSGLGLSLVRDVVEALGGRIWVEHSPDGTLFGFALPYRRARDVSVEPSTSRTPANPA
jgi:signal transduction histidine kinase